ncbi:retrotransposon ORF1 [Tanacetum coccineum]|uniref:Retrotransposon ORF1 n=1 Tax=Tanacetum coccineum TaxID=301880 RepID=A0ABQ5I6P4_9ASTR
MSILFGNLSSKPNNASQKQDLDIFMKADSDDEEEYEFQRNKFGAPIYGPKPARYLNCSDPLDRSLALQEVMNPFRKICVLKKLVRFLGSLPVALQHVEWKPDYTGCFNKKEDSDGQWHAEIRLTDPYGNIYDQGFTIGGNNDEAGSSRTKRSRQYKTVEEVLLPQVHHEFLLWEGCNRDAKSRYNTKLAYLHPRHVYSPCVMNWEVLNRIGCGEEIDEMLRIKLCEAGTNEEIFISMTWIRDFNINEPIYSELCHEFYSTYEFDEVCAEDELQTKKIIKFRLGGRAYSLTLLEFARRLGLYHAKELDEEGFGVYFQGGLLSDEHFNAQEYWLSISRDENLSLSRSHAFTIRNPVLKVAQDGHLWLVLEDNWEFDAPVYCRDLDTTTLRELIDSEGRLIPKDPRPDVPRVAIPRAQRASMHDLYERMGSMKIRQGAIERMAYRQSELTTHLDMLNRGMINIISSSHPSHHIISSSNSKMMSSIEMTLVGCVTASNWLERYPAGSILTWEDHTTRFLAQFFPLGRTAKLRNDILTFQQHQRESLSEAWTRFKDLLQKVPHRGIDLWLQPVQVNKISSLCEICSGPHDTQYCMENPKQAFIDYASSRTDEAGDDSREEGPRVDVNAEAGEMKVEYFDIFLTRSELAYHKKINPRNDLNRGVSNFMRRIKGMHVFVGNFTYVIDFMIVEDISSIIDPRLSQVVLGKSFIEMSNMTHDPSEGIVRFTNGTNEIAYKMPHKIEQYNSLSDLEKEHTKSVYLRNEEEKRRGV